MKYLLRLLAVFIMAGSSYAQSKLPACPSSDYFHNCFGTYTFAGGDKYVGEFKDGKRNGQGAYTSANGNKFYVGEWKDNKPNGQGATTIANGDKYVGEFKDGKPNGQGTRTYADGDKYVGEFKDDRRNGQGTHTFASGNKYVGEWKDSKRNGQGTEYASNGSITNQGIWTDGSFFRSAPAQQGTVPNQEIERFRAEADEAKRRLVEAEERMPTN